jgi:hypothetical protein
MADRIPGRLTYTGELARRIMHDTGLHHLDLGARPPLATGASTLESQQVPPRVRPSVHSLSPSSSSCLKASMRVWNDVRDSQVSIKRLCGFRLLLSTAIFSSWRAAHGPHSSTDSTSPVLTGLNCASPKRLGRY